MARTHSFAKFPGRAAMFAALSASPGSSWTTRDLWAWSRHNGGNAPAFQALNWYVRRGKLSYEANVWRVTKSTDGAT